VVAALDLVSENRGYLMLAVVITAGLAGLAALLPRAQPGSARGGPEPPS
jgi:hypothetical protein